MDVIASPWPQHGLFLFIQSWLYLPGLFIHCSNHSHRMGSNFILFNAIHKQAANSTHGISHRKKHNWSTNDSITGAKITGKQFEKCLYGILPNKEERINEFFFLAPNCAIVYQPPVPFISGHKWIIYFICAYDCSNFLVLNMYFYICMYIYTSIHIHYSLLNEVQMWKLLEQDLVINRFSVNVEGSNIYSKQ